jgi:hypothetical protein
MDNTLGRTRVSRSPRRPTCARGSVGDHRELQRQDPVRQSALLRCDFALAVPGRMPGPGRSMPAFLIGRSGAATSEGGRFR